MKNGKSLTVKLTMSCKENYGVRTIICTQYFEFCVGQTSNITNKVILNKEQIRHAEYRKLKISRTFTHLAGKCSTYSRYIYTYVWRNQPSRPRTERKNENTKTKHISIVHET